MKFPTEFFLKRLSSGILCPTGDEDFSLLHERFKTVDVDNFTAVLKEVGLQPGTIVVDVGAFIGDTAIVFTNFGAKVYAFEPFFDAFVCLVYNTRDLGVRCINAAVGDGEIITPDHARDKPGENYGMRSFINGPGDDPWQAVRLDDCIPEGQKIGFLKVDCEGSEIPALLGARKLIARDRPILFVEMYKAGQESRGFTPEKLEETIKSLGYTLKMIGEPPRWDWLCYPI